MGHKNDLGDLVSMGDATAEKAFELLQQMYDLGRNPRRMPTHYRELQQ